VDHYKTALNILPSYLEAHNDLAILLQETGDLQGAGERLPRGWMRLGADVIRAGPNRTVAKRVARKKARPVKPLGTSPSKASLLCVEISFGIAGIIRCAAGHRRSFN
jgi:hypothetical protein